MVWLCSVLFSKGKSLIRVYALFQWYASSNVVTTEIRASKKCRANSDVCFLHFVRIIIIIIIKKPKQKVRYEIP